MTDAIRLVLKRYWGHDGFWPLQEEAMRCVLAGRDSIVVLPTGGGKSLCLQAPAMVKRGLTLVVSPNFALTGRLGPGSEARGSGMPDRCP